MRITVWACASTILLVAGAARADEADPEASPTALTSSVDVLVGDYSSFLHGPVSGQHATAFLDGGWDSAAPEWRVGVHGLLPVWNRFSLVLGATYREATDLWRPSAGVAFALLRPSGEGAAVDLLLQYKTEGFSEPEGELELTVRSGYRWHRTAVTLEASYGQDPEANERDGELAADASLVAGRFSLGVGTRARRNLGGKQELILWDVQAGPHAGLVILPGHYVGLTGGVSALSIHDETKSGVFGALSYALAY